jgi:hypothetical protein
MLSHDNTSIISTMASTPTKVNEMLRIVEIVEGSSMMSSYRRDEIVDPNSIYLSRVKPRRVSGVTRLPRTFRRSDRKI